MIPTPTIGEQTWQIIRLIWFNRDPINFLNWAKRYIYIYTYIVDPPINAFRFVICHSICQPFGVQHVACASGAYWKTITTLNQRQVGRLRRKKSEARTRFLIARSLEFLVYEKTMAEVSFVPKPLFLSSAHLFICESCSGKTSKWY